MARDDPLLDQVKELAAMCGWLGHHQRPALTSDGRYISAIAGQPGWPDLVLIHHKRRDLLIVEIKSTDSKVTDDQETWLMLLRECGCDAQVWRPQYWHYIQWRLSAEGVPSEWRGVSVDKQEVGTIPTVEKGK